MNLHAKTSSKRIRQWLRAAEKKEAHYDAVAAKHELGTPWWTRAVRNWGVQRRIIADCQRELARRGEAA